MSKQNRNFSIVTVVEYISVDEPDKSLKYFVEEISLKNELEELVNEIKNIDKDVTLDDLAETLVKAIKEYYVVLNNSLKYNYYVWLDDYRNLHVIDGLISELLYDNSFNYHTQSVLEELEDKLSSANIEKLDIFMFTVCVFKRRSPAFMIDPRLLK